MIRITIDRTRHGRVEPALDMGLAHAYCAGMGIELRAGAHHPFGLTGSINVAPKQGADGFRELQLSLCGAYTEVDVWSELTDFAKHFLVGSQDYVIADHVLDAELNLQRVLDESEQVLKDGGVFFAVVRKDRSPRHGTSAQVALKDYRAVPPHEIAIVSESVEHQYTCEDSANAVQLYKPLWELLEVQQSDSYVGNVHTFVFRVSKSSVAEGTGSEDDLHALPNDMRGRSTGDEALVRLHGSNPFAAKSVSMPSATKNPH